MNLKATIQATRQFPQLNAVHAEEWLILPQQNANLTLAGDHYPDAVGWSFKGSPQTHKQLLGGVHRRERQTLGM
ncbi:hypothetical protein MACH15_20400 [Maricaulis maris]|nr:hypothetical protein MACH15_20400 [Maricaulis maris]